MKFFIRLMLFTTIPILMTSSSMYQRMDYTKGMNNNVCKSLRNNTLVYFIFVDTKTTSPWTEFDIQSTIDSMEVAIQWLEREATKYNISLNIISDYYIGTEYTTVSKSLPMPTVSESAQTPNLKKGLASLNKWADNIARTVGAEVHIVEKDGIPEITNPKNKERLVAHLRDEKQVESVALLYMVNNYYRNDISLCVNHLDTYDVEFSIVSYKYPAVIAQNILNLFGAADLAESVYRRQDKKIRLGQDLFPNDIMQDVYGKSLNNLEIGLYTRYLIGWEKQLTNDAQPLLTDKIVNY